MNPIIIEPKSGMAEACVIWLHGLGADGNDFASLYPQLKLPADHRIRFVFPTAPIGPVTVNGGMPMRRWYDIRSLDLLHDVDAAGIRVSCYRVFGWIQDQIDQGIAPEKIVLAGFSQGGVIALHTALSYEYRLAGVMALSTYFPLPQQFFQHRGLPIFMAYGLSDKILPLSVVEQSREALVKKGYDVEWHTYPMEHTVCPQEIEDISRWLQHVLKGEVGG
ncbi:alpha/beta hydrolase [Galenea microaerophila]